MSEQKQPLSVRVEIAEFPATIPAVTAHDDGSGVTYTLWTDGWAVGYRCEHPDGRVEYIYLNPSTSEGPGDASVFVYQGGQGDPAFDGAHHFYNMDTHKP